MNYYWAAFAAIPGTFMRMIPTVAFNAAIVAINEKIEEISDDNFPNNRFFKYGAEGMTKSIEQAYLINIIAQEGSLPAQPVQGAIFY